MSQVIRGMARLTNLLFIFALVYLALGSPHAHESRRQIRGAKALFFPRTRPSLMDDYLIRTLGAASDRDSSKFESKEKTLYFVDDNDLGEKKDAGTLRQVTVAFRHGQRTPADTFPTDPHINDTMAPYGWGQLTNKGKLNQYNQGVFLRKRYGHFLGTVYSPEVFWLQSTAVDRAQMSAMLEAAGLWPPGGVQTFKDGLPWQPTSLHYQELDRDTLLLVRTACPAYYQELERVKNSTEIVKLNKESQLLYEALSNLTGWSISSPDDVMSLYGTLRAESDMNLNLPEWTDDYYPEKLLPLTIISYLINTRTVLLRRLKGGPFVKKIVNDMVDKFEGKLKPEKRKMFMYSGHDSTITNLLSTLGVWEPQMPDYNVLAMIELHEDSDGWNVQMYLRNTTNREPYPLTLPGCTFACPLDHFVTLLEPVIPVDWDAECKIDDPDYVAPTPLPP